MTPRRWHTPYGFDKLRPGESFFVPASERANLASAASMYGRANGKRFSIRKGVEKDDNGNPIKGFRCWRIG